MQNNCLVTHILVHHPQTRNEERLIKEISARRGAVASGKGPGQAPRVAGTERERAGRRKRCRNSSVLVPQCCCPCGKALLPCTSFHAALELGYFTLVGFCRAPTATVPWVQFSFNTFKKANNPIFCKPPSFPRICSWLLWRQRCGCSSSSGTVQRSTRGFSCWLQVPSPSKGSCGRLPLSHGKKMKMEVSLAKAAEKSSGIFNFHSPLLVSFGGTPQGRVHCLPTLL